MHRGSPPIKNIGLESKIKDITWVNDVQKGVLRSRSWMKRRCKKMFITEALKKERFAALATWLK